MSDLISGIGSIFDFVGEVFSRVFDTVVYLAQALINFYDNLVSFDGRIVDMVTAARGGNVQGLPINGAIATYHYLVGDLAFYLSYIIIMFGCLFTIYKLGVLIYATFTQYRNNLTGGNTKAGFLSKLTGIFK